MMLSSYGIRYEEAVKAFDEDADGLALRRSLAALELDLSRRVRVNRSVGGVSNVALVDLLNAVWDKLDNR